MTTNLDNLWELDFQEGLSVSQGNINGRWVDRTRRVHEIGISFNYLATSLQSRYHTFVGQRVDKIERTS